MNILTRNTLAVALSLGCALAANARPATHAAKKKVIRSVFTLPANPNQGRDPFFPESNRPYAVAAAANPRVADVSSLVVNGFSGPPSHRLVIINNHTFGVGDEGDVNTTVGRIHLRCLEISTNSVVIQVGGQRHELFYSNEL